MSVNYRAVGWNRQKRIYDLVMLASVGVFLIGFTALGRIVDPNLTSITLMIRATAVAAFVLLHVTLSIGPLCRLDPRFLPLLYNRRHMGVTVFALAAVHAFLVYAQFHANGVLHPLVSILVGSDRYDSLAWFPFQPLGLGALIILLLMAATSHDFWLRNLTAPVWKALHMLVYLAYALAVAHVALGALQPERSPVLLALLGLGVAWIVGLHALSATRHRVIAPDTGDDFVDVAAVSEIADKRAKIVEISGERVAVFRDGNRISAVSNVCQHQSGPLGEGRIGKNGCIACPWHGYEYEPATGASPPPFTERIPTFNVRVEGDRVLVHPRPNAPGTRVEPAVVEGVR